MLFVAGLLHDIGKLLLIQYLADAAKGAPVPSPAWAFERTAIGIDHAEAGALVTAKWNLAPEIQDVIKAHHDEAAPTATKGAALVRLADVVAHELGIGYLPQKAPPAVVAPGDLQVLGITPEAWTPLRDQLAVSMDEAVAALGNLSS
jgi:putative nucleotidyltransferase with HDIG domain